MMKNKFVFIAIFSFIVLGAVFYYCFSDDLFREKFKVVHFEGHKEDKEILALVKELNKNYKNYDIKIKEPVDIYVGGFRGGFSSDIINKEHFNILIIGGNKRISMFYVKPFDLVAVSVVDLNYFFNKHKVNSIFFPIVANFDGVNTGGCAKNPNKENCYFALFGENKSVEEYMIKNNIRYRKIDDVLYTPSQKEIDELDNVSGVIAGISKFDNASRDISRYYIEAGIRKIPILSSVFVNENMQTAEKIPLFFSDYICYYLNDKEISNFFIDKKYRDRKAEENYYFLKTFFSTQKSAERMLEKLGTPKDKKKRKVSIFTPSIVGHVNNGDYWLSKDLEYSFKKKGFDTVLYYTTSMIANIGDIDIYLGGGMPLVNDLTKEKSVSILNILYPFLSNDVKVKNNADFELGTYIGRITPQCRKVDRVVSSSRMIVEALREINIKAFYVPQFTNTDKFYEDYDENLKSEILFVGNHHFERVAAKTALENGFDISIYGYGWGDKAIKSYVDNNILRKYYSSAKIVLSDAMPLMKKLGFVSNRIYDVSATGAFIISDYIKEIEDVYGDAIPMWKTKEELVFLLNYYLDPKNDEERKAKAQKAQKITLERFTADKVRDMLIEVANDVKK